MIRLRERKVGGLLVLLTSCLLAGGCGSSSGTSKQPPTAAIKVVGSDGIPSKPPTEKGSSPAPVTKPSPQEFVGNFLKAAGEGQANADSLTLAFKKKIARPEQNDAAQQKLGYNPNKVEEFLKKASYGNPEKALDLGQADSGPFFHGSLKTAGGPVENCLIRLIPSDAAAGWQIDWFQRTTAKGPAYTLENPGPDLIGAMLAAHEFLENLLGGDLTLAEAVMSNAWKRDLAWSTTDSNKEQGYDSKLLQNLKLKPLKQNFTEFSFRKREAALGKPAIFEGDLMSADGKETKPFALKAAKNETGEWVVEDFK